MIRYHFDLYPRDDPRDGARVVRFTKLQSAEYRGEANGTGSGRLSIRADAAEAQLIDPRGLQYVRVVREDTVAVTEAVVGGFFLDSGDFTMLDTNGTRLLSFGGAGTLSYLARAIMASHTYISPIFTGQDPIGGIWNLWNQSTFYANGNFLGAMLWRVLYEAQHNTPGNHKHADGVIYADTHADDRPAIAIPDMVFNFDQYEDTNGNDWTLSSGEFKAQVGENVLSVIKRLMEAGLYVSMDPDTFELSAYQAATHRRDRTGGAWGASVVRFQAPVGEDITTGNIKSDAKRAIAAFIKRSWVLAGGSSDVYGDATGTTDIPWEGFYYADVNDATAAAGIAGVQTGARDDAGDTLRLRSRLGTAVSSGYYRPFEDARLDDLVTVHTGTDQFDHDEQDFPIAAITINLRPGGDWDVWYDLGSSYAAASSRQFQVPPVAAHNHPIPYCIAGVSGAMAQVAREEGASGAASWTLLFDVIAASNAALVAFVGSKQNDDVTVTWRPNGDAVGEQALTRKEVAGWNGTDYEMGLYVLLDPTPGEAGVSRMLVANTDAQSTTLLIRHVSNALQDADNLIRSVNSASGSGTSISIPLPASHSTGDLLGVGIANNFGNISFTGDETDIQHVSTVGIVGSTAQKVAGSASTAFAGTITGSGLWGGFSYSLAPASAGSGGDGNIDLIGSGTGVKRCSDTEHYHTDRDPTSGDTFASGGWRHNTLWVNESTGAAFLLTDEDAGTWVELAGGGATDHGALTGLADDDHPQYVLKSAPVTDHGTVGATEDFDFTDGTDHEGVLDQNLTVTLSGATNGEAAWMTLKLTQDGSGTNTLTLPAEVVNGSDVETAFDTAASAVNVISVFSYDGGSTWYAFLAGGGGGASALDDLTDVTITAPAEDDHLQYVGGEWVNNNRYRAIVTDGFDTLVWEGDDLVWEWSS
jgi:hypothetical protein